MRRSGAVLGALVALSFAAATGVAVADDAVDETVVGEVEALATDDVLDVESLTGEAVLGEEGALVRHTKCTISQPRYFRRVLTSRGHVVYTPSGNVNFVCHVSVPLSIIRAPLDNGLVVDNLVCEIDNKRRTRDSHLVITPSGEVILTCHIHPEGMP